MAYRLIVPLGLLSFLSCGQTVARTETFAEFFTRFRAALASGRAADVAALTRLPFLYEGRQLDAAGFTRIVPFYFGRDDAGKGGILLLEFAADGEDAR